MHVLAIDPPQARLIDDAFWLEPTSRGVCAHIYLAAPGLQAPPNSAYFELVRSTYATALSPWAKRELETLHPEVAACSLSTPGVQALYTRFGLERPLHPTNIEVRMSDLPALERIRQDGEGASEEAAPVLEALEALGGLGALMRSTNLAITQWALAHEIPMLGKGSGGLCRFDVTRRVAGQPYTTWTSPLRRFPDLLHGLQAMTYLSTGALVWSQAEVDAEASRFEAMGRGAPPKTLSERLGRAPEKVLRPVDALTRHAARCGLELEASYQELPDAGWHCRFEIPALGLEAESVASNKRHARRDAARAMLAAWVAREG